MLLKLRKSARFTPSFFTTAKGNDHGDCILSIIFVLIISAIVVSIVCLLFMETRYGLYFSCLYIHLASIRYSKATFLINSLYCFCCFSSERFGQNIRIFKEHHPFLLGYVLFVYSIAMFLWVYNALQVVRCFLMKFYNFKIQVQSLVFHIAYTVYFHFFFQKIIQHYFTDL